MEKVVQKKAEAVKASRSDGPKVARYNSWEGAKGVSVRLPHASDVRQPATCQASSPCGFELTSRRRMVLALAAPQDLIVQMRWYIARRSLDRQPIDAAA